MRPVRWGDGTRWGDPNVHWGSPSYRLEPGDPGYVSAPNFPPPPPLFQTHTHTKTMNTDYIPQSEENLKDWLDRQVEKFTAQRAGEVGATEAERASFLAAVNTILGVLGPVVQKQQELDELRANLALVEKEQLPILRAMIKRFRTSSGCTPAVEVEQEWAGTSHDFDASTARPTITAKAMRGRVKITGKKPGFEAYNLYWRKKGGVEWKLMAIRKRKFPYFDETPLAVADTPEVREYMAIGVIDDEETGQPSEIKEVVYAG
jgi:hypothetical protein